MRPLSPRLIPVAGAGLLAAVVIWVYAPALHGAWLWDDASEVTGNIALRSPGGLRAIWTGAAGLDYWPLTGTVRWLQWHAWGPRPFGYHLTNVGLHLLGALLLWRVVAGLGTGGTALQAGSFAALIFALHPLAVESVAWVSELKNVLSLPCLLLAFLSYTAFDRSGRTRDWLGSLGWFGASLLAKSSAVMFPCVLLLFIWWRRGAVKRTDLAWTLPFFALSVTSAAVTLWFQKHRALAGVVPDGLGSSPAFSPGAVQTAVVAVGFYFWKCLWPLKLAPVYPQFAAMVLPQSARGTGRAILFGLGCFVLNLVPVLGLAPMAFARYSPVSDHLAYISLACFAALAGTALAALPKSLGVATGVLLAALLAVVSRHYSPVFRGPIEFWSCAVRESPSSAVAHFNLGTELAQRRRNAEAISEFKAAVRISPKDFEAQTNLGGLLWIAGRKAEALEHFRAALEANPNSASAHCDLGVALRGLHHTNEAIAEFETALRLDPHLDPARDDLIGAYKAVGRFDDAFSLQREAR